MKKRLVSRLFTLLILITAVVFSQSVSYADEDSVLSLTLNGNDSTTGVTLYSQDVDGTRYFMLPSGVKADNITSELSDDVSYETMQSANIASIFFVSADPEKKGMAYVNGSEDHSTKAKGMVYMYDKDFNLIYSGPVDALKGRGNTTWIWSDKKPYQMKLEKKADLLDPAEGKQKNKTWILLSNPFDPTLIKNTMVYNFAKEIGLENTPDGRAVDMYYDGIYRGSYFLCEKVEIDDYRVEINDLESDIEDANPNVEDMDDLETATAKNSYGKEFSYVKGLEDPEDISGGYLLEIDHVYYKGEKSWFNLGDTHYWVSKSPEYLSENASKYISEHCYEVFNYIKTQQKKYGTGSEVFDYLDEESFVKYFLAMEFFHNNDVWTSSTYMYKPSNSEKLYAGPIWDCDSIMGVRDIEKDPTGWKAVGVGKYLLSMPEFRKSIKEIYVSEFRPVINDTLLGDADGDYLQTYNNMKDEIAASLVMNDMLWEYNNVGGAYYFDDTAEENYNSLYSLMRTRAEWMDKAIMSDSFTKNTIKVNKAKTPTLKATYKNKTVKVTIPKTKYTISNIVGKKTTYANQYQVAYKLKGAKKWKTVKTSKQSLTLKKLKKNKTYYVKVRAIAKTNSGTKYGSYSKAKSVKIKRK